MNVEISNEQKESCEDCISREQAKKAIRDKFKNLPSRVEINTVLNDLPSVTSIRKRGKWVANHDESDDSHSIDCSCCNYTLVIVVNRGYTAEQALDCVKDMTKNYCPNCGAEMGCE